MKRSSNEIIRNYTKKLFDNDLDFIASRLIDNYAGDLANCLEFLQKNTEIDKTLDSADGVNDFYDIIDLLRENVLLELRKRSQHAK